MTHSTVEPGDEPAGDAPHPDEVEDHAPRIAWRELLMEREQAAERYRAWKRRLLADG